jgi:hypothetical protein
LVSKGNKPTKLLSIQKRSSKKKIIGERGRGGKGVVGVVLSLQGQGGFDFSKDLEIFPRVQANHG